MVTNYKRDPLVSTWRDMKAPEGFVTAYYPCEVKVRLVPVVGSLTLYQMEMAHTRVTFHTRGLTRENATRRLRELFREQVTEWTAEHE
jgi:hypothetical protein